jgi:hypothetical protein
MSDKHFGKIYNQLESRTITIGGVLVVLAYFLKDKDPSNIMYYWYFIYGYIILTLLLTIRAYCRKKEQEKEDAYTRLKESA